MEPCVLKSVSGNKCKLRKQDGTLIEDAYVEDVVIIPEGSQETEPHRQKRRVAVSDSKDAPPSAAGAGAGSALAAQQGMLMERQFLPRADGDWARRSIGQMLESPPPGDDGGKKVSPGKLSKLFPGKVVLYKGPLPKVCRVGAAHQILKAESKVVARQ